jgi:hypothetical protein
MRRILTFIPLLISLNLAAAFAEASDSVKGMIVYAAIAGDGSGSSLYAISPDGKIKKRLTMGLGADCYPAVSPDGRTIVFSALAGDYKYRIFSIDGAGGHLKELAETGHDAILASWSPDGRKIAFLDRDSDHTTCIYLVNPDGTGLTMLASDAEHDDDYQYPPLWSGDGKRILYDKKDMLSKNTGMPACMYVVNTDGSGETPVGDHDQTQYDGSWCAVNGNVVYYSEKREFDYNRQDNAGIFIMDSRGAGVRFLASGYRPVCPPTALSSPTPLPPPVTTIYSSCIPTAQGLEGRRYLQTGKAKKSEATPYLCKSHSTIRRASKTPCGRLTER